MKRAWFLIVAVASVVIVSKLLFEDVLGLGLETMVSTWVIHAGAGSALTVVGLLAVDIFLPIPSSLVMVLSGAAFGTWWGALLSLVGSVGGEWLGFELVRRYGRRASRRIVSDEELGRLERVLEQYGVAAVIITRALPVVMETMSVVAGLSRMKRSAFLLASLAGTAPVVLAYAYAGSVSRQVGSAVPAVVMAMAVAGGAFVWYRARILHQPVDDPRESVEPLR